MEDVENRIAKVKKDVDVEGAAASSDINIDGGSVDTISDDRNAAQQTTTTADVAIAACNEIARLEQERVCFRRAECWFHVC